MKNTDSTPRICPSCGARLPAWALHGLCPRCVFKVSLPIATEAEEPEESPLDQRNTDKAPPPPSTGSARVFGDYELLEEIARGGMGVVYKARQINLNRVVALKMILAGRFADAEFIQRFRAEAEAAAGLQHPNIVAIHEVGEHEGQHYFSMDYIEGQNLAQMSSGFGARGAEFRRIARWMKIIAEAIDYAHQRGIIHRDLKPSNVLIDHNDEPRITDFGLAKQIGCDSDLTTTGQILGSPNYLPPEQASGKRADVGVRSDVYSLGAILYHLLTARPPFVAETLQNTLLEVLQREPIAPRLLNPSVPVDLETICLKCLEKEPANRYASAQALAEELERFLEDHPILARPVSAAEKYGRWCRRNPVVASLSAATALLLLAVAIGSPIAAIRIDRARRLATLKAEESRQRLVRLNVANGTRAVSEGDLLNLSILPWFVEALRLDKGYAEQEQIHHMRLELILRDCPKRVRCWFHAGGVDNSEFRSRADAQFSPNGQHVLSIGIRPTADGGKESEVAIWNVSDGKAAFPPIKRQGVVYHAEFSPDGRRFVTASGVFKDNASVEGEARVWDAANGTPISPPLKQDGVVSYASFSSDGRRVVTATRRRTQQSSLESDALIWDATSGALLAQPMRHSCEVLLAQFSPNDDKVITSAAEWTAFHGEKHCAATWDSATGQPLTKPVWLHGPLRDVRYQADQIHFLAVSPEGPPEARVSDAATGALVLPLLRHQGGIVDAHFSGDGTRIVTASVDYSAAVWDATTGRVKIPGLKHGDFVRKAVFSPDDRRVVTASFDGTARVWDAISGRPMSPPLPHHAPVIQASFSPDGRRILTRTVDQMVQIWEFPSPFLPTLTMATPGPVRQVKFSPDGRRVLTTGVDGAARIWDAKTGLRSSPPLAHQAPVASGTFSHDGRLVATGSEDYTARVWDAGTGKAATPPLQHNGIVWSVRFSPDNSRVITASGLPFKGPRRFRPPGPNGNRIPRDLEQESQSGEAVVWNAKTGARLFALVHSNTVTYTEFSPDGRAIVTASADKTARLWDAATGLPISPPLTHSTAVLHASFSPDSRRIVTARGGEPFAGGDAQVWDVASGQLLLPPLTHGESVVFAIFSPDGQRVATASGDNAARIWDASTGEALTPFLRHPREVTHLAFSSDGKLLVTTSANHARVWDVSTGEPITPPIMHPDGVISGEFSPEGDRIVTACRDGRARVWNLRPYHLDKEEMILWTQVLSARQIDRTGTDLEPLSIGTLSNAWQKLRSKPSRLLAVP